MIELMVNGLPGKMATEFANSVCKSEDMKLFPFALTGPEINEPHYFITGRYSIYINLITPEKKANFISKFKNEDTWPDIAVDFTQLSAVNENVDFYCENHLSFVMGTTIEDEETLEQKIKNSNICAVIGSNMAKQIIIFQAMMKYAAETFPNSFNGYLLKVRESHQKTKKGLSGTARDAIKSFNKLGIEFTEEQALKIRDPQIQEHLLGVPKECLDAHGWHTYTLKSPDKSVLFEFTHNINGRSIFTQGTLDAVRFLYNKTQQGKKGQVYSMVDVLKAKL